MSWPCRFLETPPMASFEGDGKTYHYVDTRQLKCGDMWYARGDDGQVVSEERRRGMHLTAHYWAHNAGRPPIMVLLPQRYSTGPGLQEFCVDGQCHNGERGYYDGWTVSGTPPQITVSPSINMVGSYHGYLQNGVVTDDVDGRKFEGL